MLTMPHNFFTAKMEDLLMVMLKMNLPQVQSHQKRKVQRLKGVLFRRLNAKAEGKKAPAVSGVVALGNVKPAKVASQKKDGSSVAASEKGGGYRPDKYRKKDVPHPRLQFDDKSRVEKAKKRAVVKQTEARNRVELFRHLPQYEHGTQLPDLESKFFHLDPVHPAVYKL